MPVSITISHEEAGGALHDLSVLAKGLLEPRQVVVSRASVEPADAAPVVRSDTAAETDTRNNAAEPASQNLATTTNTERAGETEPRRRGRKSNAEKAAEAAAAQAAGAPPMSAAQAEAHQAPASIAVDPQDAKDEAEESAVTRPATLTHDDVRNVLGAYVKKYGMAAAQEDGPQIIGYPKISDIPDDQEKLKAAVAAVQAAVESNPKKRALVGTVVS